MLLLLYIDRAQEEEGDVGSTLNDMAALRPSFRPRRKTALYILNIEATAIIICPRQLYISDFIFGANFQMLAQLFGIHLDGAQFKKRKFDSKQIWGYYLELESDLSKSQFK